MRPDLAARVASGITRHLGEMASLRDPARGGLWTGRATINRVPAGIAGMADMAYEIAPTAHLAAADYGARAPSVGAVLSVGSERWIVDRAERDRGMYVLTLREDVA